MLQYAGCPELARRYFSAGTANWHDADDHIDSNPGAFFFPRSTPADQITAGEKWGTAKCLTTVFKLNYVIVSEEAGLPSVAEFREWLRDPVALMDEWPVYPGGKPHGCLMIAFLGFS
jgi:hypothetical protein